MSEIRTPWGSISTQVSLFPIYYLIFIYGFVYILPFGKDLIGMKFSNDIKSYWIERKKRLGTMDKQF